jgi:N-acetylmuramoyl-L-alanine amidase
MSALNHQTIGSSTSAHVARNGVTVSQHGDVMRLISREQWLAVAWLGGSPAFQAASIDHMTAHYAGANGLNVGTQTQDEAMLNAMQNDYRTNRGYDLGYSYCIAMDGTVYEIRGQRVRAASDGYENTNTETVSTLFLLPNETSDLTSAQILAAQELMTLVRRTCLGAQHWVGHRDEYPTSCPGDIIYHYVTTHRLEPTMQPAHNPTAPMYVSNGAGAVLYSPSPCVWHAITGPEFYAARALTLAADTVVISDSDFVALVSKATP